MQQRKGEFWGGQNFTMPKDYRFKIGMRDLAIYDEWHHGCTFDALARKVDISDLGLRKLIECVSKRLAQRRKSHLPDLLDRLNPDRKKAQAPTVTNTGT